MAAFFRSMKTIASDIFALLAVPSGTLSGALILYCMMAADLVTGLLCAVMGRSYKSKDGSFSLLMLARGLIRKILMLLVIFLAALLDRFVGMQGVLCGTALWFYIGHEGLSVMENLMHMGVPVPERLQSLLRSGSRET